MPVKSVGTALDAPLPILRSLRSSPGKSTTTAGLRGGNRKRRHAFYPPGEHAFYPPGENEHRVRGMKEELTTILEAMRAAHAELADYLVSGDRNAELTIAKLVGILERREVVRAMR